VTNSGHGGGPAAFHLILRFVAAPCSREQISASPPARIQKPQGELCFETKDHPHSPSQNRNPVILCDTGSSRFFVAHHPVGTAKLAANPIAHPPRSAANIQLRQSLSPEHSAPSPAGDGRADFWMHSISPCRAFRIWWALLICASCLSWI